MNVNDSFLHGALDEEVFVISPPDYCKKGETHMSHPYKSLYGLNEASRKWFFKLSSTLVAIGFSQSKVDKSLFYILVVTLLQ